MPTHIQVLNLSGNELTNFSSLSFSPLTLCTKLRSLHLKRNLIELAPNYRYIIFNLLPTLNLLDGSPNTTGVDHKNTSGHNSDRDGGKVPHKSTDPITSMGLMLYEASTALELIVEARDDERRLEDQLSWLDETNGGQNYEGYGTGEGGVYNMDMYTSTAGGGGGQNYEGSSGHGYHIHGKAAYTYMYIPYEYTLYNHLYNYIYTHYAV